jgi:hypothetical protein
VLISSGRILFVDREVDGSALGHVNNSVSVSPGLSLQRRQAVVAVDGPTELRIPNCDFAILDQPGNLEMVKEQGWSPFVSAWGRCRVHRYFIELPQPRPFQTERNMTKRANALSLPLRSCKF